MGKYLVPKNGYKVFVDGIEITGFTKIEPIKIELNEVDSASEKNKDFSIPAYGEEITIAYSFTDLVSVDSIDLMSNGKIFSTVDIPKDRSIFPRELIIFLLEYYKTVFHIGYIINTINQDNIEEKIIGI